MIMKKILPIMALVSFSVISFAKDNYDEKCSLVKNVEIGLSVYPTIIESINNYFLNNGIDVGNVSKTRKIINYKDWYIAEVEVENGEPVVILINKVNNKLSVKGLFGGTAAPEKTIYAIRREFKKKNPNVPSILLNCYVPVGEPFNN